MTIVSVSGGLKKLPFHQLVVLLPEISMIVSAPFTSVSVVVNTPEALVNRFCPCGPPR